MATTWKILVDWGNDGVYTQTHDDVTDWTISANWFLGYRRAYQEISDNPMLELVLDNSDRRFSPENNSVSNPLAGKVRPLKKIKIQSTTSEAGTRTHWVGWIESLQPDVGENGQRLMRIIAAGAIKFFRNSETDLALQENQRTDQIVAALLGAIAPLSFPTTSLDQGRTRLAVAADNWVYRGGSPDQRNTFSILHALWDVVAAERGRLFFDREGGAVFWNRHHLLDEIPAYSYYFDNNVQDMAYLYSSLDDLKNEIIVVCHPRTISDTNEVVWSLGKPLKIPSNESVTITARYEDDTGYRIGGKDVFISESELWGGDPANITNAIFYGNSAELTITNNENWNVYVTKLTLKGKKITDFGQVEVKVSDSQSILTYGKRTLRLNIPAVDNVEAATYIANFELNRRKDPRGTVQAITVSGSGTVEDIDHNRQLALTIGDRVGVRENQTQHGVDESDPDFFEYYHIIGEAHRLTDGARLHATTWYLEPALTPEDYPWKLNDSERSKLGSTTILTY